MLAFAERIKLASNLGGVLNFDGVVSRESQASKETDKKP